MYRFGIHPVSVRFFSNKYFSLGRCCLLVWASFFVSSFCDASLSTRMRAISINPTSIICSEFRIQLNQVYFVKHPQVSILLLVLNMSICVFYPDTIYMTICVSLSTYYSQLKEGAVQMRFFKSSCCYFSWELDLMQQHQKTRSQNDQLYQCQPNLQSMKQIESI